MAILEIDKLLTSPPKNRIARVGIELEGGWFEEPFEDCSFHHDGSVKELVHPSKPLLTGEIVSNPIAPVGIPAWVKSHYPDAVNKTCGLHLHMSFFHDRHYQRLMTIDYQDTLLAYLGAWAKKEGFPVFHHIWGRLAGHEKYCHKEFWPDDQMKNLDHGDQSGPDRFFKKGSRYTVVNYCYNIKKRGTLEVRVLPMMETPEQAIRGLMLVVRITNACIFALRSTARDERLRFDVPVDISNEIIEEDYVTL